MTEAISDQLSGLSENERRVRRVERDAAEAFRGHECKLRHASVGFASWRCGRPDSGIFAFNITVEPGRLFVTGDLGLLVVERTQDMIAWCRDAIASISYFAEKVPHEIETSEWSPEVAKEELRALIDEDYIAGSKRGDALEVIDRVEGWTREQFFRELIDAGIYESGDLPSCDAWRTRFLWQREAIKWFLNCDDVWNAPLAPSGYR